MLFSRFFKGTNMAIDTRDTPVERFMKDNDTHKRVNLFLGHTVNDSPDDEICENAETRDALRFFQESSFDSTISPCESYVSVSDKLHFDPREVNVNSKVVASFIRNPIPISPISIPGVDININNILSQAGFYTTHQVIGKFIMYYSGRISIKDVADSFYRWLGSIGVVENKATITASLAEKIGTWIPEFYETTVYKY